MMRLGILRCKQTGDICPGTTDFSFMREKQGVFEGVAGEIELIGLNDCGGCPGKKAVFRAREMVKRGALASCIAKGTPIGYSCPFAKKMRDTVSKDLGEGIRILEYTH